MASTPPRPRLLTLEAARGLAAFAVVVFHANASSAHLGWTVWEWPKALQHGVDFFFVLSGFIMVHAWRAKFGQRDKLGQYALRRAIRLLPMLWLIATALFLLRGVVLGDFEVERYLRSVVPYPSLQQTMPAVVWTLTHEFFFYTVFAALIVSLRWGLVLFAIWALACVGQLFLIAAGSPISGTASFFVSSFAFQFFLGMLVAFLHRKYAFRWAAAPLALGIAAAAALCYCESVFGLARAGEFDYTSPQSAYMTIGFGLAFALVLHGLIMADKIVATPRFLVRLGETTYTLFLSHAVINGAASQLLDPGPGSALSQGLGALLLVVLGVAFGFVLHGLVEKPVTRWLNRRLLTERSPGVT